MPGDRGDKTRGNNDPERDELAVTPRECRPRVDVVEDPRDDVMHYVGIDVGEAVDDLASQLAVGAQDLGAALETHLL
jgi:hypothetical protein